MRAASRFAILLSRIFWTVCIGLLEGGILTNALLLLLSEGLGCLRLCCQRSRLAAVVAKRPQVIAVVVLVHDEKQPVYTRA